MRLMTQPDSDNDQDINVDVLPDGSLQWSWGGGYSLRLTMADIEAALVLRETYYDQPEK